jgi:GcrA cell cycle regulator
VFACVPPDARDRHAGRGVKFQHSSHCGANTMSANRATAMPATWSSERIELLERHFNAGLSCSQIAREIGVTRNAVIGKMNRLGLSRPKEVIAGQREHRRGARLERAKAPGSFRPRRARLSVFVQHELLAAAFGAEEPRAEEVPIANGCGCTLLELSRENCRWPISTAGAADFRFCGNEPVKGLPYCLGHARIAYRPAGRRRSSAVGA